MRQHHLGDMRREDPGDRQRVARGLQHHPVARRQARREQLEPVAARRDPTRRPRPAALADRDLAEVAMHVQPDEPAHRHLHGSHDNERETEGERHLRIRARSAPGQVAGAASYTIGLAAHRKRPACPSAFSQSPRPGTAATLTPRPDAPADAPSTSSCRYTKPRDVTGPGGPATTDLSPRVPAAALAWSPAAGQGSSLTA